MSTCDLALLLTSSQINHQEKVVGYALWDWHGWSLGRERYNLANPLLPIRRNKYRSKERLYPLPDELALLAGVRKLDKQALTEAHDTYYPAIFRYISFRVGDQQTAEDLTSEVFTRLLSAVRDRSAPDNTLRGWLYGVASRVVADHHRKQYRTEKTTLDENMAGEAADPLDTVSHMQTLEALHDALSELTKDQQDVIALRFGYEMPIKEVAQTLGKSVGSVKQLQARAVAALSRKLTPKRNQ